MRIIYTFILTACCTLFLQAQRISSKLYFKIGSSTSVEIEKASGPGGFTDSTRWYVQTATNTFKALSTYGNTAATNAIRETDTLVIEGIEMVIEHGINISLPSNVRYIYLGSPKKNGVTLLIDNGATFTMNNSFAAMSIASKGILKLGAGASNPTQIVLLNTVKALNTAAIPVQTTGEAINGATIGASAYTTQPLSVATPTSSFGGFTQLGALPVVLVNFDAIKQSNGIYLRWTTQQESNLEEFIVERSIDGKSYELAGRMNASGNASIAQNYSFIDPSPLSGIVYYRVRMIDMDGKQGLTAVKAVRVNNTSVKVGIYPNPAISYANIVINSEGPAPVYVGIYNQLGMQMTTCTNIGGNALTLDLAGFPAGLYMIDVKFSDGSRKTERLSVVKR